MVNILLQAALPPITDPSTFINQYQAMLPAWTNAVTPYMNRLWWLLATIEMGWLGVQILARHRMEDHQGILMTFTMKVLALGFWLAMMQNAGVWMPSIINSLIQIGKAGTNMPDIGPSMIMMQGAHITLNLLATSAGASFMLNPITGICFAGAALVVFLCFVFIMIQFVLIKIESFLVMAGGIILLGLGGSEWTRQYAEKYVGYAFQVGFKIMMIYMVIGAGWSVSNSWIGLALQAPFTVAGVLAGWYVAAGALIYLCIVWTIPHWISSALSGGPSLSHQHMMGLTSSIIGATTSLVMMSSGVGAALGLTGVAGAAGKSGAATNAAASTNATTAMTPSPSPTVPPSNPPTGNP